MSRPDAEAARSAAERQFESLGGALADPPVLMPASLPLELSGEAVRARLCVFADGAGEEQALRPDLTLPIARAEAALRLAGDDGSDGARTVRYSARAFRLPAHAGDPLEFTQVGVEQFGLAASPEADTAMLSAVAAAVDAASAPVGAAWLGDVAVFPAFVDALGLTAGVARTLKRRFRQAGRIETLLAAPRAGEAPGHALARLLRNAPPEAAAEALDEVFALAGISPVGERTREDILARLLEKGEDADAGGLPDAARATLQAVLAVEGPLSGAAGQLSEIARDAGLTGLEPVIESVDARARLIAGALPELAAIARFGTSFGRRFTYYDGFVFELFAPGAAPTRPFGAGGRYDTLIRQLSQGVVSAPAIGGVVRPDRLAEAAAGNRS